MASTSCPICATEVAHWGESSQEPGRPWSHGSWYDCPNCGQYSISFEVLESLQTTGKVGPKVRAALSHGIWCSQQMGKRFAVLPEVLEAARKQDLPEPAEQLDRLVLFLGKKQASPGTCVCMLIGCLRAKLGAFDRDGELFIIKAAVSEGLIDSERSRRDELRLTMAGWKRFREIERGAVVSRMAFMAMPFGNEVVRKIVDEVFRPALEQMGFKLRRVDDDPKAGSIDDRIRVDIRLSRFVIADLTCGNLGAYWEAGYAEGLGKPVIYTCNAAWFDKEGTHFDTNHHQTVPWDPAEPEKAAEDLKATIRATLPFEAKMADDPSE